MVKRLKQMEGDLEYAILHPFRIFRIIDRSIAILMCKLTVSVKFSTSTILHRTQLLRAETQRPSREGVDLAFIRWIRKILTGSQLLLMFMTLHSTVRGKQWIWNPKRDRWRVSFEVWLKLCFRTSEIAIQDREWNSRQRMNTPQQLLFFLTVSVSYDWISSLHS